MTRRPLRSIGRWCFLGARYEMAASFARRNNCVTNDNQAAAGETLRSKNILPQVRGRVVDRRLHRSSATSRDRLHGIVDAEDVVTPRQKGSVRAGTLSASLLAV